MRKNILLAAALLFAALGARSQDTLNMCSPISDYYCPVWLDTAQNAYLMGECRFNYDDKWFGLGMYTKDTLTVYGIAYSVYNHEKDLYGYSPYTWTDTTLDDVYEYVGLFVRDADSLIPYGNPLKMHAWGAPLYYMNYSGPTIGNEQYAIFPFYESYYDTPLQVVDTFYVCNSNRSDKDRERKVNGNWEGPKYFLVRNYIVEPSRLYPIQNVVGNLTDGHWTFHPFGTYFFMMFPILTPPDTTHTPVDTTHVDTTHVDTTHVDTVGISTQMLERYTALQPNPATERVLVTSSFGLQSITLYNAAGIKVYERPATGYSTTLDVSTLPVGTYLVRLATPRGTVTKKLVVQRR